jgi:Lar family restriction alleviation protein
MSVLKPCPFCGGEASYRDDGRWEKVYDEGGAIVDVDISSPCVFVIECSCGAQIVSDESEDAVRAAWNRRADHLPDATKKVTNADRIRSMNDEELAWFINLSPEMEFEVCLYCTNGNTVPDDRGICLRPRGVCAANDRRDAFLDWLKQPVKEEHNEAD